MDNETGIPCSFCKKHDSRVGTFTCKPHECQKLSDWLSKNSQIMCSEDKVGLLPIPYVV